MTEPVADQAPEQSVEDRISAKFGITDEPEQPQENIQAEGQDETEEVKEETQDEVEIEYEGERFKVPKQLEKAILQERDYTRKTQELAEQRRQVEHEKLVTKAVQMEREFAESVATEMQQLTGLDNYLRHLEGIDVRTLTLDDQIAHLAELQRVPRQREAVQKQIDGKRSEFEGKAKEAIASIREKAKEALSRSIPGFNDELLGSISTYAKSVGFNEQDVDGITADPRSSSVIYKAMRYDQLQASKQEAVKKATPAIKPGASNPMPSAVKDRLNFRKTLKAATSSQDKAKLIEQYLAR